MNFLIGAILLAICVFVGFKVASTYKKKLNFVTDFKSFLNILETNIMFTQDNLNKILTESKNTFHKEFSDFLTKYISNQQNSIEMLNKWKSEQNLLDNDTAEVVYNFMSNLGRNDSNSQLQAIKQSNEFLNSHMDKVSKEQTKGSMSLKLGIMGGLALFIIVL